MEYFFCMTVSYALQISGLSRATFRDESNERSVVLWFESARLRDDFVTNLIEMRDFRSIIGYRLRSDGYIIRAATLDPDSIYAIKSVRQIIHFLSSDPFYKASIRPIPVSLKVPIPTPHRFSFTVSHPPFTIRAPVPLFDD